MGPQAVLRPVRHRTGWHPMARPAVSQPGTLPQRMGANRSVGLPLLRIWLGEPMCRFTYQPSAGGPLATFLNTVVTLADPLALAVTVSRGYLTGPWIWQEPRWMWAAWTLEGARPVAVSSTVRVLV